MPKKVFDEPEVSGSLRHPGGDVPELMSPLKRLLNVDGHLVSADHCGDRRSGRSGSTRSHLGPKAAVVESLENGPRRVTSSERPGLSHWEIVKAAKLCTGHSSLQGAERL